LHGIPEILAYLVAGLGGGILSVGIVKEEFGSKELNNVLIDVLIFLVIAEFLIFGAAWIEAIF